MLWSRYISRACASSPISIILILLISADLSILMDIIVFRQIMGFIFLTFVPGVLFLYIIKLDKLGMAEKFVLSVGISLSFVMFSGLIINTLYPIFGYKTPLSLISLVISLTALILILAFIARLRVQTQSFLSIKQRDLKLNIKDKAIFLIPLSFPVLCILGVHLINTVDNNLMLIGLFFLIPSYVILISILHDHISEKAYPLIIFLISISLILPMGMRSSHIIGVDSHLEYYIFQNTLSNEMWQILIKSTLDSCLSISILPAIYEKFLNINQEYLFKILYPLLFSISPLIIYLISKMYIGSFYAFLASVFFMLQATFLNATSNSRTVVAVLFFGLSMMVLLDGRLSEIQKKLLLIIFIISCVFSHYSTSYIFLIVLTFVCIIQHAIHRLTLDRTRPAIGKIPISDNQNIADPISRARALRSSKTSITGGILMIIFVMIFIWYSQATGVAFDNGVWFFFHTIESMKDFFILESRQENVALAFGSGFEELSIPRRISFFFNWLTIIYIVIGVLFTLAKCRQRVAYPNKYDNDLVSFLIRKMDITFISLAFVCSTVMAASVAMPFFSKGYGMDRTYLHMLVVLSPFFILGGLELARLIHLKRSYLMILVILIPYSLCATGTMHNILGSPLSIMLNSQGPQYNDYYIHEQEVYACRWLGNKGEENIYYADFTGHSRLISQGRIRIDNISSLVDFFEQDRKLDGYIYLRYFNIRFKRLIGPTFSEEQELSKYSRRLSIEKRIYGNGGSEIWS